MELVEQIGSGMSRILKAYDPSIFELTPSFTIVTFPFERAFISSNNKTDDNQKSDTKTTLDVIKDDPAATIKHISELTGKSPRTISRELKKYQDTGLLRHEGARKNGKWVISSDEY
jgi:predicted HTH transcriptional regulator